MARKKKTDQEKIDNFRTDKKGVEKSAPIKKQKKKIAIVGYAPSSRHLAPYNDQEWEIWGVNELYKIASRVDVLFELHHRKWFKSKERNPQHLEWLQNTTIPVFTLEKYEDIPSSVRFPIEDVKECLPDYLKDYFTNSISYMIAMIIFLAKQNPEFDFEYGIWGIDMSTMEEYGSQRPSIEAFVGYAQGLGIPCYIPPQADLFKTQWQYGYEGDEITQTKKKMAARKKEVLERIQGHERESQHHREMAISLKGAYDDVQYWERCFIYDMTKNEGKLNVPSQ